MKEIRYYCPYCEKPFTKTIGEGKELAFVCEKHETPIPASLLLCPACLNQRAVVPIKGKYVEDDSIAYCENCVNMAQFRICLSLGECNNKLCKGVLLTDEEKVVCRDETCKNKYGRKLDDFVFLEYGKEVSRERLREILISVFKGKDWPLGLSIDVRYKALKPKIYQLSLFGEDKHERRYNLEWRISHSRLCQSEDCAGACTKQSLGKSTEGVCWAKYME